ncbi:DUF4232 domain-containing protein [Dactylosporangium sp. NPDC050588]|uniref:DUF4232 domain-containing protein n=1 Tax=Dactylosporangium sp. NPDC050588 TaxID=3157211 RepID=UPI003406684F
MTDRFETWLDEQQVELLAPPPGAYPSIARSARRRRAGRAVAGVAAATLAVAVAAGAVHQVMNPDRPPDQPATTPTAAPTAGPTETPTTGPTEGPTAAGSTGAATPAGSATTQQVTGRCRTGDLRVTAMSAPGGGAAGGVYSWLVFTNTSGRTCSLYGFPGVSYVTGASGTQINEPAKREGTAPVRVDLAPGQGAHAQVRTGQSSAYPDTCHPVEAAGYRVYVPDETASVFVPWRMKVCSTDGVNGMLIGPVFPGTSG